MTLHEELEHLRHVGGKIIEERLAGYKHENALLKQTLDKNKIAIPTMREAQDSGEKLTKSEEAKLQEYYKR